MNLTKQQCLAQLPDWDASACPLSTDTIPFRRHVGSRLWEVTYKHHPDDDDFASVASVNSFAQSASPGGAAIRRMIERGGSDGDRQAKIELQRFVLQTSFPARWVDCASRMLSTTHKYAAAMMATDISREAYAEIRLPAPAFVVDIPDGLLPTEKGGWFTRASFLVLRGVRSQQGLTNTAWLEFATKEMQGSGADAMAGNAYGDDAVQAVLFPGMESNGMTTREELVMDLGRRLVVGLLYTLQFTPHFKEHGGAPRGHGIELRDSPPPHRNIFVGRPIDVDARPGIRSLVAQAVSRRAAPPSVQTLVRGHLKRQVHGPAGAFRRVIWIEPYWRGPEGAPILARPLRMGGSL